MNHQHKFDLVGSERCRVLRQKTEASELYDKAISGAKGNTCNNKHSPTN
jgi:hypothetical protein